MVRIITIHSLYFAYSEMKLDYDVAIKDNVRWDGKHRQCLWIQNGILEVCWTSPYIHFITRGIVFCFFFFAFQFNSVSSTRLDCLNHIKLEMAYIFMLQELEASREAREQLLWIT